MVFYLLYLLQFHPYIILLLITLTFYQASSRFISSITQSLRFPSNGISHPMNILLEFKCTLSLILNMLFYFFERSCHPIYCSAFF